MRDVGRVSGWNLTILAVTLGCLGHSADAGATLNPKTYRSPSGEYELFVDSTDMGGAGPGQYRLLRGAQEVWSGKRPMTLREAAVTDDGVVLGYAYEGGVRDSGHHGLGYKGLAVFILGPDGSVRLRDPVSAHDTRFPGNFWAGSDSPYVIGMLVDPQLDRFVLRIPAQETPVVWWTYRISTAERTGDIVVEHPKAGPMGFVREFGAWTVPGTPLTLVHWCIRDYDEDGGTAAATVSLLDVQGRQVWTLAVPAEYDDLDEEWDWFWDIGEPGYEQVVVREQGFDFRSYSHASSLSFAISPDSEAESGWRIVETQRVPDELPRGPIAKERPQLARVELQPAGRITLQAPASHASPIGHTGWFAIDPAGNLGFVRGDGDEGLLFVRVDPEGNVLTNARLKLPDNDGVPSIVPVTANRWVLLVSTFGEGATTRGWWVDARTGELEAIESFGSGSIEWLLPTGDGGFLALVRHHLEYTIQDELARYDKQGKLMWNRREPGYGHGFSFESAAWLPGRGVAALTSVADTIEFFDPDGTHERSIRVSDIIGGEPNYPSGLTAGINGGLVLHDFQGNPSLYRIDANDKVTARFRPRFPDGRTFRLYGFNVAPNGRLWVSDNHSLLRLDENGVVDRILGARPDEDGLDEIVAMTVDQDGRIYAVDSRTAAVHVFNSNGALLKTCRPLPRDFAIDSGIGSITVDGQGDIYYKTGGSSAADEDEAYMHMRANCERVGFEWLGLDSISEGWLFKPRSRERWVLGYQAIHLVDAEGKTIRTIHRRPNQDWLEIVHDGAVAPNGALAVIAGPQGMGSSGPAVLNVYAPNGDPVVSTPLAEESMSTRLAFNGSTVVTSEGNALYLYELDGKLPRKVLLPGDDGWWYPYFSPDGTEIWLRSVDSKELLRYKLP